MSKITGLYVPLRKLREVGGKTMADCKVIGKYDCKGFDQLKRIYSADKLAPTVTTGFSGNSEIKTDENCGTIKRYRRLTEYECFRLMGVKEEDYNRVKQNQCKSSLYHLAGDSIVTSCIMAIFGELLDIDYNTKIDQLAEEIANSTRNKR